MTKTLSFCDSALTDAVRSNAAKLQSFKQILEDTSNDIKRLEEWLLQCAVCFPTYVQISDQDHIGWDKFGTTWRLVLESAMDEPPETRPLIDTPIKVRLAARNHLPELVREIASAIPLDSAAVSRATTVEALEDIFAQDDEVPF